MREWMVSVGAMLYSGLRRDRRNLGCRILTNAPKPLARGVRHAEVVTMAKARLRCNLCGDPLVGHCPDTNPVCVWFVCRNHGCSAHIYDLHRGLLRHMDGRVEGWAEAGDDGRTSAPDA